ncbi:Vacuolar protein sorting-associated protein 8 [Candida viswanathii]|uniref:Vacuolar protein sorting-associated protein 8 n=1 Tax=Candida viswanathii TaxID=5486 RepID=A0A367XMK1_9ASCO|nr:Vacuolar protein sorting-associated protein 8 [Candida viswanathii]
MSLTSSPSSTSLLSSTSSSTITPLRKTKFDDRSRTKTGISLRMYSSGEAKTRTVNVDNNEGVTGRESMLRDIFKWNEMNELTKVIKSGEFIMQHGNFRFFKSNSIYIAIVTTGARIIVFNYRQEVEFVLSVEPRELSLITCVAFSGDCSHLCAGFEDGSIKIWNLKNSNEEQEILPVYTIYPISLKSRFVQNAQGHIINTKITFVSFIGDSNHQIVSTDDSGLMFFHNGIKKFMNLMYVTSKLLGRNDANLKDEKFKILNCEMLPLGSSVEITDKMGIVAVMTSELLIIVSTISLNDPSIPFVKQHFKIGKSKRVTGESLDTCLSWFPSMQTAEGTTTNAKLCYAWNNVLTILELENQVFSYRVVKLINDAKDKDKVISKLPLKVTCRWVSDHGIKSVKWIQSDVLCVFTDNHEMITFYYVDENLTAIAKDSIDPTFQNINASKRRILCSNATTSLFIGQLLGWADILVNKLSEEAFADALSIADNYYNSSNSGKLTIVGLPRDKKQRGELIQPYLVKIMKESLPHLFSESDKKSYISLCLNIIAYINDIELLEQLYDVVDDDAVYFQSLEPLILSGNIISLPPVVLKKLVQFYIKEQNGDLLTEIVCTLDIKTLDIDLTIQLCNEFHLKECLIYIWNFVLHDYATPLMEFLEELEKGDAVDDFRVYAYMAYILTGRQYPTDRFLEDENAARKAVCDILFSSTAIENIPCLNPDTIFPYLFTLLKFNSFEMLSTLNEFFEDPFLNEDPRLTRQYLIETLLDIYEINDEEFTQFDKCQLLIFISRNYPKYSQFLRLSESTLFEVIDSLCQNQNPTIVEDCELGLLSLLPVYDGQDYDEFIIEKLEMAKYYNVLISIYRSEGKYSNALETWLKKENQNGGQGDGQLSNLLESSFVSSKNASDRLNLVKIIRENFEKFMKLDDQFIRLIERFTPNLHLEVLNLSPESDTYVFSYLRELFKISQTDLTAYLTKYLELLIVYDTDQVIPFVETWEDKFEYGEVYGICEKNEITEAQTILLVNNHKYEQALDVIIQAMNKSLPSTKETQEVFAKLLRLSFATIEPPSMAQELNQKLWIILINHLVELSHNQDVHDFINECIHDSFIFMNNNKNDTSFFEILNKFIIDSNDQKTLSNIKKILHQVFISYSTDSEILKVIKYMLNKDIYKKMNDVKDKTLEGWIIENLRCSCCDLKIVGKGVDLSEHYLAYEEREKQKIWKLSSSTINSFKELSIIFFSCGHGYHKKCLKNLLVNNYCVICNQ